MAKTRALIDVDVLLDTLAKREPHYESSSQVLVAIERGNLDGLVAAHTLTTLFYLVAKYSSRETARRALNDLLSLLEVATVDRETIEAALALPVEDFEDAVQMAAAVKAGAEYLVTRNVKDYKEGPLPAISPAEFLPLIESD